MKFNIEAFKSVLSKSNKVSNLIFLFLLGIALLVISNIFVTNNKTIQERSLPLLENPNIENNSSTNTSFEEIIEERLKRVLKQVEGVGDVDIMLTISYGKELIIAEDIKNELSTTNDNEKSNTNQTQTELIEKKTVIVNQNGSTNEPIILKEIQPKVEGVVIVAQGGDNVVIKDQLTRATSALLNIPSHKIEILKMKK